MVERGAPKIMESLKIIVRGKKKMVKLLYGKSYSLRLFVINIDNMPLL
jgi:hypothetical protein